MARFPPGLRLESLRREHPRAAFSSGQAAVDPWIHGQALVDCHAAGATFPFIAVVLDCVDEQAKAFYQRWDFRELPGRALRLFLPVRALGAMMGSDLGGEPPARARRDKEH
jgi:hypothetical protein